MNVKRVLTSLIGFPIVVVLLMFGDRIKYLMDVVFAVVAIIAMHEYINCVSNKSKVISWISYLIVASIAIIHLIPAFALHFILILSIPILLLILFMHIIVSDMSISFENIAYTLFGIMYIYCFIVFLPILYGSPGGKYLIWIVIFSAWGTDTFAYIFGCKFGKRRFSKVSPKKSIEGCVAGTIGAVLVNLIYIYCLNRFGNFGIPYFTTGVIALFLSIIGQIGDFAASTIKRHFEVKDFGNMFPGHGGMIDRIDSVMFIAPFAYFLLIVFV